MSTFTNDWNVVFDSKPIGSDPANVAVDLKATRNGIREIVGIEHDFDTSDVANQGKHLQGSAKTFYQASAPSNSPGGDTLGSEDAGRIWVDSDNNQYSYVWTGSSFTLLRADSKAGCQTYFQYAEPTLSPTGVALGSSDAGRLWIDSNDRNALYVWNGSAFDLLCRKKQVYALNGTNVSNYAMANFGLSVGLEIGEQCMCNGYFYFNPTVTNVYTMLYIQRTESSGHNQTLYYYAKNTSTMSMATFTTTGTVIYGSAALAVFN